MLGVTSDATQDVDNYNVQDVCLLEYLQGTMTN